jgi:hypothetical protein
VLVVLGRSSVGRLEAHTGRLGKVLDLVGPNQFKSVCKNRGTKTHAVCDERSRSWVSAGTVLDCHMCSAARTPGIPALARCIEVVVRMKFVEVLKDMVNLLTDMAVVLS